MRPSRFSRRSKRPAHSDDRSGSEPRSAADRETLERADEHGQLQVRLRDAYRRDAHARAVEHVLPVAQLAGAGLAVPRAPLGLIGLELEQVPAERPLQP